MAGDKNSEISLNCSIIDIGDHTECRNCLQKRKLILVEGKDDLYFLNFFLKYLDLTDIEVRTIGGIFEKNDFVSFIKAHKGIMELQGLGLVLDADEDTANERYIRIRSQLEDINRDPPREKLRFNCPETRGDFPSDPIRTGIYLFPDNEAKGRLEDLFLNCVSGKQGMRCVDPFINCVETLEEIPNNLAKSRVLAFLATQKETVRGIGGAAQKGICNYEASALTSLREFIRKL
jgi:hypothetical protein